MKSSMPMVACDACYGRGEVETGIGTMTCSDCHGAGYVPTPVSEDLTVALHTLAKYCVIGARNPHHYQNVGLQHKHLVALLQALGVEPPTE